jgi:2-dehydro-3-deoxy-D-arabinonate dehydratase
MQLGKIRRPTGDTVVLIDRGQIFTLNRTTTLADVLHAANPAQAAKEALDPAVTSEPLGHQTFLAPIDRQEIWAAGVTYKRSKVAREEESKGAAQFYDKVYTAARPELFLKATAERVVGPGQPIRVRADSKWNVPEPELTLVVAPSLQIVGFTIGNDVSSRDIEGENPLYLPQAKVYKQSCSIGPLITLAGSMPEFSGTEIRLVVRRGGKIGFEGTTTLAQMARTPESLVEWLGKDNEFPHGVLLLTGTGIVPPDDFNLSSGDVVDISIAGIGTLTNPVA